MRSFFYNLDKISSSAYNSHNRELYSLSCDVRRYVLEGSFTRYKKANILLGYWGETDSYTASMLGMKEGTVRVTRRNLSNELYELLGYDFFSVIGVGDKKAIAEGRNRLGLVLMGTSADDFLYREIINSIVVSSDPGDMVDIKSCAMEIQFLEKHSKTTIAKELAMLDKTKLAFLIRVLNNESGSALNRYNLIRCFEK